MKEGEKIIIPDREKIQRIIAALESEPHSTGKRGDQPEWWVRVQTFRDMHSRLPVAPGRYILPLNEDNMSYAGNIPVQLRNSIIWSMPPVIAENRLSWYRESMDRLMAYDYGHFQVGHFAHSHIWKDLYRTHHECKIFADYTVNCLNSLTVDMLRREGFEGAVFSIESDRANMEDVLKVVRSRQPGFRIGMYVYGRPPLFTARLDDSRYDYGKRFVSPKGEEYILSRYDEMTIARPAIPFSLLGEWRNLLSMGVDYLVVDLAVGSMKRNISEFISHLKPRGAPPEHISGNYHETLV